MLQLNSTGLKATLNPLGAEINSLVNKQTGQQLLWNGNPDYWGRHAPLLFPIVGALKDGSFIHENKTHQLGRHGFARDSDFEVVNCLDQLCKLRLVADEGTKAIYPFNFELLVMYELKDSSLIQETVVTNLGEETLYYSYGQHPAFSFQGLLSDYALTFEKSESLERHLLDENGLRNGHTQALPMVNGSLALSEDLFKDDALVIENLESRFVSLHDNKNQQHLRLSWHGYPHLGIWKKPGAHFLCLEPWDGLADSTTTNGLLKEKDAIVALEPGQDKHYQMTMEFFL